MTDYESDREQRFLTIENENFKLRAWLSHALTCRSDGCYQCRKAAEYLISLDGGMAISDLPTPRENVTAILDCGHAVDGPKWLFTGDERAWCRECRGFEGVAHFEGTNRP